jgi:hypothetical protein
MMKRKGSVGHFPLHCGANRLKASSTKIPNTANANPPATRPPAALHARTLMEVVGNQLTNLAKIRRTNHAGNQYSRSKGSSNGMVIMKRKKVQAQKFL